MTVAWPEGYDCTKLELTLRATSKGTQITMVHSNVPLELKEELAEGWVEFYWNPLKAYFKKQEK
jgi:activator of HSP90 ATPase